MSNSIASAPSRTRSRIASALLAIVAVALVSGCVVAPYPGYYGGYYGRSYYGGGYYGGGYYGRGDWR